MMKILKWYGFKNFKIHNICPKIAFMKFPKRDKEVKPKFEPMNHRLLAYPETD